MARRRSFLKTVAKAGLCLGAGCALGPVATLRVAASGSARYDLVAVRDSDPELLFDAGMLAMGGMGQFVRPGQTVVVKPDIGWDVPPRRAANTNPRLVARVVSHCRAAGARRVYVFDHTYDAWRRAYRRSGIAGAVKRAGGILAPGDGRGYFQRVQVGGSVLEQVEEHELILESEVFINVPVLKQHDAVGLSGSMKNLMGTVWDRAEWHRNDLHRCIADFAAYRRPDLTIVDAYDVLIRNGPRGLSQEDVFRMRTQLLATDMVVADAAAARLFGMNPEEVGYISLAARQGAGRKDLANLSVRRMQLS